MEQKNEKKDIFDKIMELPILRIFNPFYKKHKEILLYLFFGGLAFIISIGSYAIANVSLGLNELVANLISWILAVLFAYITNRIWVFSSKTETLSEVVSELFSFLLGRVATLVIEEIILAVFITWLGFNSILIKVIAQIVVIVLNYIISKLLVFREKNEK